MLNRRSRDFLNSSSSMRNMRSRWYNWAAFFCFCSSLRCSRISSFCILTVTIIPAKARPENSVFSTPNESPNVPDLPKSSTVRTSAVAEAPHIPITSRDALRNSDHVLRSGVRSDVRSAALPCSRAIAFAAGTTSSLVSLARKERASIYNPPCRLRHGLPPLTQHSLKHPPAQTLRLCRNQGQHPCGEFLAVDEPARSR